MMSLSLVTSAFQPFSFTRSSTFFILRTQSRSSSHADYIHGRKILLECRLLIHRKGSIHNDSLVCGTKQLFFQQHTHKALSGPSAGQSEAALCCVTQQSENARTRATNGTVVAVAS